MNVCTQCGLPLAKRILNRKKDTYQGHFCCYGCYLTHQFTREEGESGRAQGVLIRLGLGIFFAMNVMLFSLPTYSSFFYSIESSGLDEANFIFFLRIGLVVFSTPVILLLGLPILLNSIREIARISFSVDTLIALGTFSAYGLSIYNTFKRAEHVYFDTATMLLVLVTLGRYLEARAKVKTAESLKEILNRGTAKSTVLRNGFEREIETSEIRVGDLIKILPGQKIPVDGVVESGSGGVDEASLTGEGESVFKECLSNVYSGTVSVDGTFHIKAQKIASESTLAKIARLLEEAKNSRAPIERMVDRIATIFIPSVVLIALGALISWAIKTNLEEGLLTSLSVLVVSCPCALGIATPIAIWIAFNQAAKRGVLIRNGETLERLAKIRTIFFDKTGTLTSGNLDFNEIKIHHDFQVEEESLLRQLAALASNSSHPIAKSFLVAQANSRSDNLMVTHFKTHPGLGIEGRVGNSTSLPIFLGSQHFMERVGQNVDEFFNAYINEAESDAKTVVLASQNSRVFAALTFNESMRPEAHSVAAELGDLGLNIQVLTGDSKPVSDAMREQLKEVEFQTGLLPTDKIKEIEKGRSHGCYTAMVGDGINDAPSLAAADVGIAVGTGTDLAREAANVNILSSDLRRITWLILYARRVRRKILENLFWAFFYNLVAIGLAVFGLLNPLIAALAMILSSLFVLWNSQQLSKSE